MVRAGYLGAAAVGIGWGAMPYGITVGQATGAAMGTADGQAMGAGMGTAAGIIGIAGAG